MSLYEKRLCQHGQQWVDPLERCSCTEFPAPKAQPKEQLTTSAEAVLAELVACKDLKERADVTHGTVAKVRLLSEYERRKPLAWQAARDYLAARQRGG